MPGDGRVWMERVQIDTSAPFRSVKEAVDLFGGRGTWNPRRNGGATGFAAELHPCFETNILVVEDQTKQLKNEIAAKEQETLEVLKEMESTKKVMDELKQKLHKQTSVATISSHGSLDSGKIHPIGENEEEVSSNKNPVCSSDVSESSKFMLMELKKAKVGLNRRMNYLTGYQSSLGVLEDGIEDGFSSPGNIHDRQGISTTKMSFLEKELRKTRLMLDRTRLMLQLTKDAERSNLCENECDFLRKIDPLTDAPTTEEVKISEEIEQTTDPIVHAASKMANTMKTMEVIGLSETEAPVSGENSPMVGEELCKERIEAAMLQVREANRIKMVLLERVEEAKEDINNGRKALEEAIQKLEAAHQGKLSIDGAHRKRKTKHSHRRHSIHKSHRSRSSPKFKKSPSMKQHTVDLQTCDGCKEVSGPTLSIGQILKRKLMGSEEFNTVSNEAEVVSLREMLSRQRALQMGDGAALKQFQTNKKRLGCRGFSLL